MDREIILIGTNLDREDCYSAEIAKTIGTWDIVTDEEYAILESIQYKHGFRIVERNPRSSLKPMTRTIKEYIQDYREEYEEEQRKKAHRKAQRAANAAQQRAKRIEKLKKELKELEG